MKAKAEFAQAITGTDHERLHRQEFVERLKTDDFRELGLDSPIPGSLHAFIEFLSAGSIMFRDFGLGDVARFPDLTDLNMTFGEFLHKPVHLNGREIDVVVAQEVSVNPDGYAPSPIRRAASFFELQRQHEIL